MCLKRNATSPAKLAAAGRTGPCRSSSSSSPGTAGRDCVVGELDDRAAVEELALDRAALERVARLRVEPVEARAEQRVQARRQRDRVELALEHPGASASRRSTPSSTSIATSSSAKSGLPADDLREPRPHRRRRAAIRLSSSASTSACAERLEPHRHRPVGAGLEQLRPRQAEEQQRCVVDQPREAPASRSSSAGSAQWMSSTSTTQRPLRGLPRAGSGAIAWAVWSAVADALGRARAAARSAPRPHGRPRTSSSSASSRARASAAECSSRIPASSRTICADRPEGDPLAVGETARRARRARACPIRPTSSAASRDLPTPGSPTTVTSRQPPLGDGRVELPLEQRELLARGRRAALAAGAAAARGR